MNHIHVEVESDDQYEWFRQVKDENGLSWRGMLVHAADDLEERADRWETHEE